MLLTQSATYLEVDYIGKDYPLPKSPELNFFNKVAVCGTDLTLRPFSWFWPPRQTDFRPQSPVEPMPPPFVVHPAL